MFRNPLLNRPSTAPARRTTATNNPFYKYTRANINKNPALKEYLSSLTGIEDALNELKASGVVLSSNLLVQNTLERLREMMHTMKKFQTSNYRRRKDAKRIQPYFDALRKRLDNAYLGLADRYLAHRIEMTPEVNSTSAKSQHLTRNTALQFIQRVAKDGGVPGNKAMKQVFNLLKAQKNQAAKDEKLLQNMKTSLTTNVGEIIYKQMKEQISNKLMRDLYGLTYSGDYHTQESLGTRPQLLKNTKNGLVKYIIEAENMQTIRTRKDAPLLNLGPVSVLLGILGNVMRNPDSPLTEKQAKAISKLKKSVRSRYFELVKKATQFGKQQRNERNARLAKIQKLLARPPTPRSFPGRSDTPNTLPPGIRVSTRRGSFPGPRVAWM